MVHRQPVTIQVSKREIHSYDVSRASDILASFVPVLLEKNRNRVQIEVLEFNEDPRELYDIPEVRNYFQILFRDNPGLFYWIDVESYMFIFLGLMLYEPYRVEGRAGLTPVDMQSYLIKGFTGLNKFCESTGASPDETNTTINQNLRSL